MKAHKMRTALIVAAVACATAAAPAFAHVKLVTTSPKTNGTAKRTAPSASVLFTGPLRSGTLKVTGPGAKVASIGPGARDPRNINQVLVQLKRGLKPGAYTGKWAIIAADNHAQQGTFKFKLK